MQAALRARLVAASTVSALIGTRVYWLTRPQSTALPAITLQTVNEERAQHLKGFDGYDTARVQMDVWAASYASARQIAEAAIAAVVPAETSNGAIFSRTFIEGMRDLSEQLETQEIYRVSVDLILHHASA